MDWDKDPDTGPRDGQQLHLEPHSRRAPAFSPQHHQHQHHQQFHHNQLPHRAQHHHPHAYPHQQQEREARTYRQAQGHSSNLPLDYSATAQSRDVPSSNGFGTVHDDFNIPLNPDSFYTSPDDGYDSALMPTSSHRPSGRSNPDGTSTRHPLMPSSHGHARPNNIRSASTPLDSKPPGSTAKVTGKTSVKDLKKRFDQNNTTSAIPRAPARSQPTSRTARDIPSSSKPRSGAGGTSYSALRAGIAPTTSTNSSRTASPQQSSRSRFVAEDSVSSNSQSFASRIAKPRTSLNGNPVASKSMTNLPHQSPIQPPPPSSPPTDPRTYGLLFGEILPEQFHDSIAGHGINGFHSHRTPEGGLQHHPGGHSRSFSDPDIEPPSPSNWYRDEEIDHGGTQAQDRSTPRGHVRSQSEAATSNISSAFQPPFAQPAASPSPTAAAVPSKLPVSMRKLSSPTGSTNSASTRSNSPTKPKRAQASGKASRSGTPVSRSKTPTQANTGRKPAAQPSITPNSSTRLHAHIAAPSPKLSPPLRSSRPRQPVSVATTASSRMKAVDTGRSSQKPNHKAADKTSEATRRRKISVGPIDFEQRREHIRLAYSKSIRESQALEARQKAAERRRKDMEAATKAKAAAAAAAAKAEAEAEAEAALVGPLAGLAILPATTFEMETSRVEAVDDNLTRDMENPNAVPSQEEAVTKPAETLTEYANSNTEEAPLPPTAPESSVINQSIETFEDPTFGLPGSFPALSPPLALDERPQSMVSATSETTEFDAEPQTTPPVQVQPGLDAPITVIKPPTPPGPLPVHVRAEYQYPFDEEAISPKQTLPDQGMVEAPEASEQRRTHDSEITIPGAFREDYEEALAALSSQRASLEAGVVSTPAGVEHEHIEQGPERLPFPRLEIHDDSDCHSDMVDSPEIFHDGDRTDACTEATEDRDVPDDCLSDTRTGDQISRRGSSCASSDALDTHAPDYLAVPSMASPVQRFSQQSAWTDLTVESAECSDAAASPTTQNGESPTFGHATIYTSAPFQRESGIPTPDSQHGFYSDSQLPNDSPRPSGLFGHQQASRMSTDTGLSSPYISQQPSASSSHIPVPDHEPPPIPPSATSSVPNSRRQSSLFYNQSQYSNTIIDSRRESEDFMSPMESVQSMSIHSVGSPYVGSQDGFFGAPTPSNGDSNSLSQDGDDAGKKERHRLHQRRNVIKELVDTEAVFVRDMNIVEEIYKGTAEACPRLDDKTVKLIFRNTNEIIEFHTGFLAQVKEAVSSVYVLKGGRSVSREGSILSDSTQNSSSEPNDAKDREVSLGPVFKDNIEQMKLVHESFLRSSDLAAKKLIQIQQDPTVQVWLNECNEVAKDLTAAWDLDSLLIKPMQRITKYPNLIMTLLQHTPKDHPDREALLSGKDILETAIIDINKTKKNFELVGQIVGRKRKESDVRNGFARAFGKRVDKLQASNNRPPEDPVYAKLNEKFGDDYLRLQVVLRDVEFYTRQVTAYVRDFLQYLSSVELVMRLQPGSYPELESKWVQFNISIRDLEKVALDDHLAQVRKQVIEPFELVIKAYGNPSLAMKKRQKRRIDYERSEQLKRAGKSPDSKLKELVEQYEALNDTLKKELPQLSALTEKMGNICLGNLVNIQAKWFSIWKDKMKTVLVDSPDMPDLKEIVSTFQRDFPYAQEQLANIGILNPAYKGRASQSTIASGDDVVSRVRPRPAELDTRGRGLSLGVEAPSLPTPDFVRRNSGSFTMSPNAETRSIPSPHQYYYRDYYAGIQGSVTGSAMTMSPDVAGSSRSVTGTIPASTRPSTGWSHDSGAPARPSTESAPLNRRDSSTTYGSNYTPQDSRRYSGLFHSALPEGPDDSRLSSRASSRERAPAADGYNVLWLAASLFEFNISTTKHEAGYPYLMYQAGEIFDVVAEKGELWLAKNQDDPNDKVGWIWSKHFAKLADS